MKVAGAVRFGKGADNRQRVNLNVHPFAIARDTDLVAVVDALTHPLTKVVLTSSRSLTVFALSELESAGGNATST